MKRYLIVFLLAPLLLLAADSPPIVGWGKTTWGTSLEEILRVYPEATVIPETPADKKLKPEFREQSAKAEIKTFRIADEDYRVLFFVKPSVGLHEVDITTYAETALDHKAAKLQSLLTEKYGAPKLRESEENGGVRLMWTTPSLTVELSYRYYAFPIRSYILTIAYTRPSKDVLDKL